MGFDPVRPWSYVIAASAYGARDSPMREWWSNRFVLPVLTTHTFQAARGRIAQIDGSAAACGSTQGAGSYVKPPPARSRSPDRRRRRGGDKGQDKTKGNAKTEYCNNFNVNKKPCAYRDGCPHQRIHRCRLCDGQGHSAADCGDQGKDKGKGKGKWANAKGRGGWNRR